MERWWDGKRSGRLPVGKLSRLHLGELSPTAKRRLKWFDWHRAHGENVSITCCYFGIARQTFYRWQSRYDRYSACQRYNDGARDQRTAIARAFESEPPSIPSA